MFSMSQESFNRVVTLILFAFFLVIYVLSFIMNRMVDWQSLLVFIVPTLNHVVNQVIQGQVSQTSINADVQKVVSGATNGTTTTH